MPRGSGLKKVRVSFWKKKKVRNMPVGKMFGKKPISPGEAVSKMWKVIKKYKLQLKKKKKKNDD